MNHTNHRIIETANRHLEDLDILFSSDSPLVWRAEKAFAERKQANPSIDGSLSASEAKAEP